MTDWYYTVPKEIRKHLASVLSGMQQRCYNPRMHSYKTYGCRGIGICAEWYDAEIKERRIENFMRWSLDNGYSIGLQIDRIDNSKGYEPNNCRYVTPIENARNRRDVTNITFNGETHCLGEWAEKPGVKKYILKNRIQQGLPIEKVLVSDVKEKDMYLDFRGDKVLLSELSKRFGVSRPCLRQRLKSGWSVEDAVTKKVSAGNSKFVTYKGETNSIKYFAKKYKRGYNHLTLLLRKGMSIEEAIRGKGR